MNNHWTAINRLLDEYNQLNLDSNVDYRKYYIYSIITHSTAIEGSTLTDADTQLLFDEGLTAKGKPLLDHLMNEDLKNGYDFAVIQARQKTTFSPLLLQQFNSIVMKSTGGMQSMVGGDFDSSKGDFRLCGVQVAGGKSYMNYQKVPLKVDEWCKELNLRIHTVTSVEEIYKLSFDAHLNLVTIHPWLDGNGRTARLLMNYIQFFHDVAPVKIFKADRADYLKALSTDQEKETNITFREFMEKQVIKTLKEEIKKCKTSHINEFSLRF